MKKIKNITIIFVFMFLLALFFSTQNVVFASTEPLINEPAKCLDYKNNNLYYINTNTNTITCLNTTSNQKTTFETSDYPTLITADYNGNIYYTKDGIDGLFCLDESEYTKINNYSIRDIFDLCSNIENEIFAICYDAHNTPLLIKKSETDTSFSVFCELTDITLNQNSKIACSLERNFLILFSNNNFYKITPNNILETNYEIPEIEEAVIDIKLDFYDNLYILTNSSLYKANENNYSKIDKTEFENANSFELNYISGEIIVSNNSGILTIDSENFVTKLNDQAVNIEETIYPCSIIIPKHNCFVYEYDNSLFTKTENNEDIILEKDKNYPALFLSNNYYCVLLTNIKNENITGYVKADDVQTQNQPPLNQTIRILSSNTQLYYYPTSLSQNLIAKDQNDNVISLNKNILLTLNIQNFGQPDFFENQFSQVTYNDNIYYINTNSYISVNQSTISPITTKITEDIVVYKNSDLEEELTTLEKGTNIQILEKYDTYAKICFNQNEIGYIKYNEEQPAKVSSSQLVGIILIVISIVVATIFVCVMLIKKKK